MEALLSGRNILFLQGRTKLSYQPAIKDPSHDVVDMHELVPTLASVAGSRMGSPRPQVSVPDDRNQQEERDQSLLTRRLVGGLVGSVQKASMISWSCSERPASASRAFRSTCSSPIRSLIGIKVQAVITSHSDE